MLHPGGNVLGALVVAAGRVPRARELICTHAAEAPLGNSSPFRKKRFGMSTYQIAGSVVTGDDPRLPEILGSLHGQKFRPLCLCTKPHPEMYIAKLGTRYVLKRMPNTGSAHGPDCDSFDPPPELSGLGEVLPAIEENVEEGTTVLKLGFSLTKVSGTCCSGAERQRTGNRQNERQQAGASEYAALSLGRGRLFSLGTIDGGQAQLGGDPKISFASG